MITNEQFERLMEHYRGTFIQWHLHLKKYIRIERDVFLSEFQLTLLKAMLQFDEQKSTSEDSRFERYFMSSLRKMCNTLLRRASSKKSASQKKNLSFCLRKHDLADHSSESAEQELCIRDILSSCLPSIDRQFVRMMVDGFSSTDICNSLKINHTQYRNRLRKIRGNCRLVRAVSSI